MKGRLISAAAVVGMLVLTVAGCGGGGGGGTEPAQAVPPDATVLVEAVMRPEGDLKANLESLSGRISGDPDLGGKIVAEFEKSALGSGKPLDFATEVEPWLGEKVAIGLSRYDGERFTGAVLGFQVTSSGEAERFLERRARSEGAAKAGSYEGIAFWTEPASGDVAGVFDGLLVVAEDEATFKEAVGASRGESLADQDRFTSAMAAAPSGSFANLYVDVGGLIKQAGGSISPEEELFFEFAGIEPRDATAVASVIPGSDRVEVDLSTNLVGQNVPSGDASKLLGSFPASSVAAFVSPEYGRVLGEEIDHIDARGIPGQVPPHEFKKALGEAGINVEAIAGSIGDIGAFVEGSDEASLGGAVVLETSGASEAKRTVANIGLLLRASGTHGVTAIGGRLSGFSIHSPELGRQPIVVAAGGDRIVIAYGPRGAARALARKPRTLAESPAFAEAQAALGDIPISGFVAGPAAVRLASALVPREKAAFWKVKPYLEKIEYAALGSGRAGDLATAKLILGIAK